MQSGMKEAEEKLGCCSGVNDDEGCCGDESKSNSNKQDREDKWRKTYA